MRQEMERVVREIRKAVAGKDAVIGKILAALLADGHILLDDVPGVGKTTLALALGKAVQLRCRRVQFTPDVMPSDIVGFSVYDRESGRFVFHPGVLQDTNLLLGDEINRTSGKTQSALLEAMEERQVTVDGNTYPLAEPFIVIATQNRVGAAGTQMLPYAQMDRFMIRLSIGYPDHEAQMEMLRNRQAENPLEQIRPVMGLDDLMRMRRAVCDVTVKDAVMDYISRLAIASREDARIETGISPRGVLFMNRMAKACAWMDGRDYVTGSDVRAVFPDVCSHRIILSRSARTDHTEVSEVLESLLKAVPVPDLKS